MERNLKNRKPLSLIIVTIAILMFSLFVFLVGVVDRFWLFILTGIVIGFLGIFLSQLKNWARIVLLILMSFILLQTVAGVYIHKVSMRRERKPMNFLVVISFVAVGIIPLASIVILMQPKIKEKFNKNR